MMIDGKDLGRFINAQRSTYVHALAEIRAGRKKSHWMWFIFPQIAGLGLSEMSKRYAIRDVQEATNYLKDAVLGTRLVEICETLLENSGGDVHIIFGSPDDQKLKSSMTLFAVVPGANVVFQQVLNRFFKGEKDEKTLQLINRNE